MSAQNRLYFSFVSEDNIKDGQKAGWVDELVRYLTVFLNKVNGLNPEIVILDSDGKNTPATLGSTDGIVIVNSEAYLKKAAYKKIIPLTSDPSRIYKIDISPIRKSLQPKELRLFNEFHFFESSNAKVQQFVTSGPRGTSQNFWLKMVDLAFAISRTMYQRAAGEEMGGHKTVFLAETGYDQINNRDEIKRELERYGHTVLPAVPFSENPGEFEKQLQECLQKADLSVHLIGEEYGEILEGTEKSIVERQNELASRFFASKQNGNSELFQRLIWMPLNLRPRSDQQKLYLDQLREDVTSTAGAEIIQTPLEILKSVIHTRLQIHEREQKAALKKEQQKSDKKSIYVLFDKKDEKDVVDLLNTVNSGPFSVILPPFEGKQIELLERHRESLIRSDGVLLFANQNLNWVNSKLNDMIKAPGFGKNTPFEAKAIVIKDASIPKDKIANFGDLIVLNGDAKGKGATDLGPFFDKISVK